MNGFNIINVFIFVSFLLYAAPELPLFPYYGTDGEYVSKRNVGLFHDHNVEDCGETAESGIVFL